MSDGTEEAARGYLYGTRDEFETNMREVGSDVRLLETLLRMVRMEGVLDGDSEAAALYRERLGIARLEVLTRMARLEVQTRTERKAQMGFSSDPT